MRKASPRKSSQLAGPSALPIAPKGMGDVLPPFARDRRELSQILLNHFGLCGYELVTAPLFEHASVVEQGNDDADPRDQLRFVEPESGEVAVFRPDITPQIARIVATRLGPERPGPYRLAYEGRILRRRRGRARNHCQVAQVGLECAGLEGPAGDIETIALAAGSCDRAGLRSYRVELCTSALVRPLISGVRAPFRARVAELVASKDTEGLRSSARDAGLSRTTLSRLEAIVEHYGDQSVLTHARKTFRWPGARTAIGDLQAIAEGLNSQGLGESLHVDLSETRGFTYYTGASFQIFAPGPGEAICGGGRYDDLLGRFGAAMPASGFAIDLENLLWALKAAGTSFEGPRTRRCALVGTSPQEMSLAQALRDQGIGVAVLKNGTTAKEALAFADSWGYSAALVPTRSKIRAWRVCDGQSRTHETTSAAPDSALIEWAFSDFDSNKD